MNNINNLIENHFFSMRVWNDNYGKGLFICLSPNSLLLNTVEDNLEAGDLDMIPSSEYLLSTNWLPICLGNNLADALSKLEHRLDALPKNELKRNSDWSNAIVDALEHLRDVSDENGGIEGNLNQLSDDYKLVFNNK